MPCQTTDVFIVYYIIVHDIVCVQMQEQLCVIDNRNSVTEGKCASKSSDSVEILATSFSELSIITSPTQSFTQSSVETASCTESITVDGSDSTTDLPQLKQYSDETLTSTESINKDIIRSKEETVVASNATYKQLATVQGLDNFTTSTDLSTLTLSSDEQLHSLEALTDVLDSRGETLVTKQQEVVVDDLGSFSKTTTCFFVPSLISDATTLTQSLDEIASCTESIKVEGADCKSDRPPLTQCSEETLPSTEPITEEIVWSKEQAVVTSSVAYEQLVRVENSVNFTTITDLSTLTLSSDETSPSIEAILDVEESKGETMVTTLEPLASTVDRSSARLKLTSITDLSSLTKLPTSFSDPGMVQSMKRILTNSNAIMEPQKQPEVIVEGSRSFSETTCLFVPSLMTDTSSATLNQPLDETVSCPESTTVTVQGSDSTSDTPPITHYSGETPPSTEPIAKEIVLSKEETVVTNSVAYEQLVKVEDSGNFTTSTTHCSGETPSSAEPTTENIV